MAASSSNINDSKYTVSNSNDSRERVTSVFEEKLTAYWHDFPVFTTEEIAYLTTNPAFYQPHEAKFVESKESPTGDFLIALREKLEKIDPAHKDLRLLFLTDRYFLESIRFAKKDGVQHRGFYYSGLRSRLLNDWPVFIKDDSRYNVLAERYCEIFKENTDVSVSEIVNKVAREYTSSEQMSENMLQAVSWYPQLKKSLDQLAADVFLLIYRDIYDASGRIKESIRRQFRLGSHSKEIEESLFGSFVESQVMVLVSDAITNNLPLEHQQLTAITHAYLARKINERSKKTSNHFENNLLAYWYDLEVPKFTPLESKILFSSQDKYALGHLEREFIKDLEVKDLPAYINELSTFIVEYRQIHAEYKELQEQLKLGRNFRIRKEGEERKESDATISINQNLNADDAKKLYKPAEEGAADLLKKLMIKYPEFNKLLDASGINTLPDGRLLYFEKIKSVLENFRAQPASAFDQFKEKLKWIATNPIKGTPDPRIKMQGVTQGPADELSRIMNAWSGDLINAEVKSDWCKRFKSMVKGMSVESIDPEAKDFNEEKVQLQLKGKLFSPNVKDAFLKLYDDILYQALDDLCDEQGHLRSSILEVLNVSQKEGEKEIGRIVSSYARNLALSSIELQLNPEESKKYTALATYVNYLTQSDPNYINNRLMIFREIKACKSKFDVIELAYDRDDALCIAGQNFIQKAYATARQILNQTPVSAADLSKLKGIMQDMSKFIENPKDTRALNNLDPINFERFPALSKAALLVEGCAHLASDLQDRSSSIVNLNNDPMVQSGRLAYQKAGELVRELVSQPHLDKAEASSFRDVAKCTGGLIRNPLGSPLEFTRVIEKAPLKKVSAWQKFGAAALIVLGVATILVGFACTGALGGLDLGMSAYVAAQIGHALIATGIAMGAMGVLGVGNIALQHANRGTFTKALESGKSSNLRSTLFGVERSAEEVRKRAEPDPLSPDPSSFGESKSPRK